jgi:hypothetical protein
VAPPGPWTTPGPTNHSVAVTLWDGPKYWMYDLWAYFSFNCAQGMNQSAGENLAEDLEGMEGIPAEDATLGSPTLQGAFDALDPEIATWQPVPGWVRTRTGEWIALESDPQHEPAEQVPDLLPEEGQGVGIELDSEMTLNGGTCYFYGPGNAAYGINSQSNPVIAGSAVDQATGYQLGGSWVAPNYGTFRPAVAPWTFSVMRDVDAAGHLVGLIGSWAHYVPNGTNTPVRLNSLYANRTSDVYAVAYNASAGHYAAGWSRDANNVQRAVRWQYLAATTNVVQDLDPNNPTRPGTAFGVNADGGVAGWVQRTKDGVNVWRAFRWNGTLNELQLPSVSDPNVILYTNVANDISASAHAVGFTDAMIVRGTTTNVQTRAAVWWAGTNGPAVLGTVGWTDPNPWRRPGRSEALGLIETTATNRVLMVGTGWTTPTGYSRAYRQVVSYNTINYATTQGIAFNLNDAAWSVIPAGWTLVTAEDVNGQEWIVGLGTDGSQSRGYVLVPQSEY